MSHKNPFLNWRNYVLSIVLVIIFTGFFLTAFISNNITESQRISCLDACTLGSTTCLNECEQILETLDENFPILEPFTMSGLMWLVWAFVIAVVAFMLSYFIGVVVRKARN